MNLKIVPCYFHYTKLIEEKWKKINRENKKNDLYEKEDFHCDINL